MTSVNSPKTIFIAPPPMSFFLSFFLSFFCSLSLVFCVFFLGGRDKYIVWTLDFKERETVKRLRWGTENLRLEKQKESTLNAHCFLLHVFPFFFKFIFIYLLIFGIRILIYLLSLFFERWLDNSTTIS